MKKKVFLTALAAIAFASCNDDNATDVKLLIGSVSSITELPFTNGSIGVFCAANDECPASNNIKYTYTSGKWKNISSSGISLYEKPATLCAYYPYQQESVDPTAMELKFQEYSTEKDLFYTTSTSSATQYQPLVAFAMERAYAKITLEITTDASFDKTCVISNIMIEGIKATSKLNITNGTYTLGAENFVNYDLQGFKIASGSSAAISFLTVPCNIGTIMLHLTVDGRVRTGSISLKDFVAGTNYNITVTISKKEEDA